MKDFSFSFDISSNYQEIVYKLNAINLIEWSINTLNTILQKAIIYTKDINYELVYYSVYIKSLWISLKSALYSED